VFLSKIALLNFKNHESLGLNFTRKINCLIGNNGVGKTNLLDAIYYICLSKSYLNSVDQQNILFKKDFFRLQASITRQGETFEIVFKLPASKRKELTVNDVPVPKLSEHVGSFPVIIISPDDNLLISGGSEERRRFIDNTISQVNHEYLDQLILYNKVLAQRNAALKSFAETRKVDKPLIESYDSQLVGAGIKIYEARKVVVQKLFPVFQAYYKLLSFEREAVNFNYNSQLNEKPFDELLKENFQRDVTLQRTDAGIHKDDIEFFMSARGSTDSNTVIQDAISRVKKFGSQGQQKSFIISIKFAQFDFIKRSKGFKPLLLIDDIFDKLDNDRSHQLISLIAGEDFGQVFITDTDDAHIKEALKGQEDLFEIFSMSI
jgi:DNA replication and repair protein RecF